MLSIVRARKFDVRNQCKEVAVLSCFSASLNVRTLHGCGEQKESRVAVAGCEAQATRTAFLVSFVPKTRTLYTYGEPETVLTILTVLANYSLSRLECLFPYLS